MGWGTAACPERRVHALSVCDDQGSSMARRRCVQKPSLFAAGPDAGEVRCVQMPCVVPLPSCSCRGQAEPKLLYRRGMGPCRGVHSGPASMDVHGRANRSEVLHCRGEAGSSRPCGKGCDATLRMPTSARARAARERGGTHAAVSVPDGTCPPPTPSSSSSCIRFSHTCARGTHLCRACGVTCGASAGTSRHWL